MSLTPLTYEILGRTAAGSESSRLAALVWRARAKDLLGPRLRLTVG